MAVSLAGKKAMGTRLTKWLRGKRALRTRLRSRWEPLWLLVPRP